MAREHAGVGVIAAADAVADHDGHGAAAIEAFDGLGVGGACESEGNCKEGYRAHSHLPQPKSAVADFGHFVEWPNPRYSEVRLGGGRPAPARREGVTALPHTRRRRHVLRRRHPTQDCLRQSDPPPAETAYTRVSATQ